MRRALLILIFGFFPVWAVLLILAAGKFTRLVPHIYADSAAWLFVAAVLCSVVTLSLSILAFRQPPPASSPSDVTDDLDG
jgi:hypothetical protein